MPYSSGGRGGIGSSTSPCNGSSRDTYSDATISDLLGGSGGGRSGLSPATIHVLGASETQPRSLRGLGGAGGGAIELTALNDITIGELGVVSVDGEAGSGDWDGGGGGGSGGSIVVAAGGVVQQAGQLQARGGDGGSTMKPLSPNGGGGGAGGRVALFGQSVDLAGGVVDVSGGRCDSGVRGSRWQSSLSFPLLGNPLEAAAIQVSQRYHIHTGNRQDCIHTMLSGTA